MEEKSQQVSLFSAPSPKRLPPVHEQVRAVSPGPHAAGYRLILFREDGEALLIPARAQEPLRLQPFDYPPSTPQGTYHVEFYDAAGKVIPPPSDGPPRIIIKYESVLRESPKPPEPAGAPAAAPESKSLALRGAADKASRSPEEADASEAQETEVTIRTPADFRRESLRQDLELRDQRLDSHKILHEYFRGMASTLTELRTLTAHWGKEELQERFEMQKLLLEQGKATLEMQAQAAATIRAQLENLEPAKPLVDVTTIATTLITAVQAIWTSSMLRQQGAFSGAVSRNSSAPKDEVVEELLNLVDPAQFRALLSDPTKARELKARIDRITAERAKPAVPQQAPETAQNPAAPPSAPAQEAPTGEEADTSSLTDEEELELAIAAETLKALKAELTQLNIQRVKAHSDAERLRLLEEIGARKTELIAFQVEYLQKLEKANAKRGT